MRTLIKRIASLVNIKNATERRFYLDIFRLSAFCALSKIITAGSLPFLSRLYTPENFGVLSGFVAMLGFISCIGAFKIEYLIPLSRSRRKAQYILAAALAVSFLIAILMTIFVFTIWPYISPDYSSIELRIFFVISAVGVLLYIILRQWLTRFECYNAIGVSQFAQAIWQVIFRLIIPFLPIGITAPGLIVGDTAGRVAVARILWNKSISFPVFRYIKEYALWLNVLKPYKKQFSIHTISSILNELPITILPLSIIFFYKETEAGYISMAYTAVQSVANVVITPVMQVFFGNITNIYHNTPQLVHSRFKRLIAQLLLLMLPAVCLVLLYGPWLFSQVFGKSWESAGTYCQILLPALVTQLAIGPTLNLLVLTRRIHRQFIINLVWAISMLALVIYNYIVSISIISYLACVSFIFTGIYLWLAFEIHNATKDLGKNRFPN